MKQYRKIILASGSPRRRELLTQAGLQFEVIKSDADETITKTEPAEIVKELSSRKAAAALQCFPPETASEPAPLIVAADTIVVLDGKVLGKPEDQADALAILKSLSGRAHKVYTGVCVLTPGDEKPALLFAEETQVEMCAFSEEDILSFIATGIPMDKAGAYAIQGLGSFLVKGIIGDFHNVMGFPLGRFLREGFAKKWFSL
ncbi:MAG: Maf family protein [Lachnospiraceae bacterium]|nr:Maf family protein [Lachnospiraceae bacterium]